jgi:hypothetical protein
MRLAPRLAEARHSDKEKTYCGFIARLTRHLSEWTLISLGVKRLLISGSQVRALVRPVFRNPRLKARSSKRRLLGHFSRLVIAVLCLCA